MDQASPDNSSIPPDATMTSAHDKELVRYVPIHTLQQLSTGRAAFDGFSSEQFPAAVLFADISGFSSLTERFAARGAEGAEVISNCLNDYFGRLIDQVRRHGGDVLKFAGDSLIAMWKADGPGDFALADQLTLAAQCALAVQDELHDYAVRDDTRMSLRIVLEAGELELLHVGGELNRWESLVRTNFLDRMAAASNLASPGEIVVHSERWPLIAQRCRGEERQGGYVVLSEVNRVLPAFPPVLPTLSADAMSAVQLFVPGVVMARVRAGQTGWLSELRRVSVVFISLADIGRKTSGARLQEIVAKIQRCIYRYDGSINKIAIDEKGALLVAAFGLPPLSHPDDPVRAIRAMLEVRDWFNRQGLPFGAGVTTGRAFCGSIGNEWRAEYTMIGDTVNLAARLMQASNGLILCDDATVQLAADQLGFSPFQSITAKGRSGEVRVAVPTGEVKATVRPRTAMVGRETERAALSDALQDLVRKQENRTVALVGEAGIGKSRLIDELFVQARTLGIQVFHGVADAMERNTPFHAWRAVFIQLFALQSITDTEARRLRVLEWLRRKPGREELAPLLNVVLPLDLKDTERTRQMFGEVRANNTHQLLAELIAEAAADKPTLLITEDAHWFDSASWAALAAVRRAVSPMVLVVGTRPIQEPWPRDYRELLARPDADTHILEGLSLDETATLVRQRLGVVSVPDSAVEVIHARSGGNALFSEELAYALRDEGHLIIDGNRCELGSESLDSATLPDSIHTLVTSRVDRLQPNQQLALKVASVVGRTFDTSILEQIFPVPEERGRIADLLEPLCEQDLIRPHGDDGFIFKHVMTQEAVYDLMLFSQRRELHKAVAGWYETEFADDLSPHYPLLAYHYDLAVSPNKAVDYFERAGQQALRRFANREAVSFYERARALETEHSLKSHPARYSHWERNLAEAHFRLGALASTKVEGGRALVHLGWPVPSTTFGRVLSLFKQLTMRTLQGWMPARFAVRDAMERKQRLWATRVLNRMTEIAIYNEDALGCLDSGLRELNISEPAGPSAELGRAYAVLAVVVGSVPLRKVASTWVKRAIDAADASGDPGALAYVLSRVSICDMYVADWRTGIDRLERSIDIASTLGDRRLREETMSVLGKTTHFSADFLRSAGLWREVGTSARISHNEQTLNWSFLGGAANMIRLGEADEALAQLEQASAWVSETASLSEEVWARGLEALGNLRLGRDERAREIAEAILPKIVGNRPVAYWTQQSNAAVAEVFLTLWERAPNDPELRRLARSACKGVRMFANVFPFGEPHAWLWRGYWHRLNGQLDKAERLLKKAIETSEQLGTSWEHARAQYELGRALGVDSAAGRGYLQQAEIQFRRMGCATELQWIAELTQKVS